MDKPVPAFVGHRMTALVALVLGVLAGWMVWHWVSRNEVASWWPLASIAACALAFVALVSLSRLTYALWMAFALVLQNLVLGMLFLAIYMLVVPLFSWIRLRDPLGLELPDDASTFWKTRDASSRDIKALRRM